METNHPDVLLLNRQAGSGSSQMGCYNRENSSIRLARRLSMYKVYRAIPRAPDEMLGYVKEDGRVYRSRPGFDDYLGKVNLSSGRVYEERFGPDREIGHVDLESGRVYLRRFGPDDYVGSVDEQGRLHRHVPVAPDEYIGVVDPFPSYAHCAGAMLLLVLPALDTDKGDDSARQEG